MSKIYFSCLFFLLFHFNLFHYKAQKYLKQVHTHNAEDNRNDFYYLFTIITRNFSNVYYWWNQILEFFGKLLTKFCFLLIIFGIFNRKSPQQLETWPPTGQRCFFLQEIKTWGVVIGNSFLHCYKSFNQLFIFFKRTSMFVWKADLWQLTWQQSLCWHRGRWRSTHRWVWRPGEPAGSSFPPLSSSGQWREGLSLQRWEAETWGQRWRIPLATPGCSHRGTWVVTAEENASVFAVFLLHGVALCSEDALERFYYLYLWSGDNPIPMMWPWISITWSRESKNSELRSSPRTGPEVVIWSGLILLMPRRWEKNSHES